MDKDLCKRVGDDVGFSVQQTSDGGYIITGEINSYNENPYRDGDLWLIKTDEDGDTMWTKIYGGSEGEVGYSVQQTSDGGYIITGYTSSYGEWPGDVWLIKTDENGDTLWTKTYGDSEHTDEGYSVQQTSDGGYIITGRTKSYGEGNYDVWLIKVAPYKGIAETDVISAQPSFKSIQSNPVNNTYQISYEIPVSSYVNLSVYNVSGRLIKTLFSGKKHAGTYRIDWDTRGLPSSIYFLRLETEKQGITKRVIVVK